MKILYFLIIGLLIFSISSMADSSTRCYTIADELHCNETTQRTGSALSGLRESVNNALEARRQKQEFYNQQQYANQQQQEQENMRSAQEENTRRFLDAHPDIVFRSEEYNQIADLIEIGYGEEEAYKKVVSRRN